MGSTLHAFFVVPWSTRNVVPRFRLDRFEMMYWDIIWKLLNDWPKGGMCTKLIYIHGPTWRPLLPRLYVSGQRPFKFQDGGHGGCIYFIFYYLMLWCSSSFAAIVPVLLSFILHFDISTLIHLYILGSFRCYGRCSVEFWGWRWNFEQEKEI